MEVLYAHCCGIDVHKQTAVACVVVQAATGRATKEIRTFGTMTDELLALAEMRSVLGFVARVQEDWLVARGALHESLNLAREIGHVRGQAIALHQLALLDFEAEQDYAAAWSLSEESLRSFVGSATTGCEVTPWLAWPASREHAATCPRLVNR